MVFGWIRRWRRKRIVRSSFPTEWSAVLQRNVRFFDHIDEELLAQLCQCIQVLVAEKNFEGCGGLELTDEHRVTIAAHVARMSIGWIRGGSGQVLRDAEFFDEVRSILVYPDAYLAKSPQHIGSGVVMDTHSGRLGEAWYRGPVILSWSDVLASSRSDNDPRNVVIHEFAHHLDMRNGSEADGVPVIESVQQARQFVQVLHRDHARLVKQCSARGQMGQGQTGVLDCYGATSPSEFFAVACEAFFEQPDWLQAEWPDTFQELCAFYFPNLSAKN